MPVEQPPVEFIRLNLARKYVWRLGFSWEIELTPEITSLFADHDDLNTPFFHVTKYRRSGQIHVLVERAYRQPREPNRVLMSAEYSIRKRTPGERVPKDLRSNQSIAARLSSQDRAYSLSCNVHFVYDDDVAPVINTVMPLPINSVGDEKLEIQGVTGVKLADDEDRKSLYEFGIFRVRDRSTHLIIEFQYQSVIATDTPQVVMDLATTFLRDLVI